MSVQVKICGFTEPDTLRAAARAGADWAGFVFFEKSPRHVEPYAAESLLLHAGNARPVALLVDPDDDLTGRIAGLGFPVLQLHGSETPERVSQIKAATGCEIWKAVGVSSADDLTYAATYAGAADRLLLDAKPPKDADVPGGTGETFDWNIIKNATGLDAFRLSWILAGGLNPENIASAIDATQARAVDVSSGVEAARGLKSAQLIRDFIEAAKA